MTDKQIIIDGVDVSGCEKQGETIAGITCGNGERIRLANEIITKHKLCKDNPNCYYKQLKRKEQEVQQAMDNYVQLDLQRVKEYNELVDLYKAKKQENKKLEKIINKSAERFCNDYLETFKENERLKSELQAKELELIMAKADLCRGCQYKNDYKAKEQECKRLKWYLKEIRDDELKNLDIELDEYETHCVDTEYSNIINLVEEALEEISPEDCRYKKDK